MSEKEIKRTRGWVGYFGGEHPASKKVVQRDKKTGQAINVWDSAAQAAKHLHINKGNITKACKYNRNSAGGFRWSFKFPELQRVYQRDKSGEIIKPYNSAIIAEKKTGVKASDIIECCVGARVYAGGFIWTFNKRVYIATDNE